MIRARAYIPRRINFGEWIQGVVRLGAVLAVLTVLTVLPVLHVLTGWYGRGFPFQHRVGPRRGN